MNMATKQVYVFEVPTIAIVNTKERILTIIENHTKRQRQHQLMLNQALSYH